MSTQQASTRKAKRDGSKAATDEQPTTERAEEVVERVAGEVTRFTRRLVARAREEVEDIVAEAQTIRRGSRPHE
jgi:hypothetical protein